MLRARIFLFILANALHLFNCVELSNWTDDRDTELVNITIANGTTYSCRVLQDVTLPPKSQPSVARVCQSVNDTECTRTDDIDISDSKPDDPVPTEEEVFEEIEEVYRSLPDVPLSDTWIIQVAQNISRMRIEYSENKYALRAIEKAQNFTKQMFHFSLLRLPELRKNVSRLQTSFAEKKSLLAERINPTGSVGESETLDLRTFVLHKGLRTLSNNCYEDVPDNWKTLTLGRKLFMDMVSDRKLMEQQVVEARMKMLSAMAEVNGLVVFIGDLTRRVEEYFELAQQSTKNKNVEMEKWFSLATQ